MNTKAKRKPGRPRKPLQDRKPVFMGIRLDEDSHQLIEKYGRENDLSNGQVIRLALKQFFG